MHLIIHAGLRKVSDSAWTLARLTSLGMGGLMGPHGVRQARALARPRQRQPHRHKSHVCASDTPCSRYKSTLREWPYSCSAYHISHNLPQMLRNAHGRADRRQISCPRTSLAQQSRSQGPVRLQSVDCTSTGPLPLKLFLWRKEEVESDGRRRAMLVKGSIAVF